eukprot:1159231-Pelagomonas_calceolata.AAC.2
MHKRGAQRTCYPAAVRFKSRDEIEQRMSIGLAETGVGKSTAESDWDLATLGRPTPSTEVGVLDLAATWIGWEAAAAAAAAPAAAPAPAAGARRAPGT